MSVGQSVWVVMASDYEQDIFGAVYATRELAEKAASAQSYYYVREEPLRVDATNPDEGES